jgi:hypothetical protein
MPGKACNIRHIAQYDLDRQVSELFGGLSREGASTFTRMPRVSSSRTKLFPSRPVAPVTNAVWIGEFLFASLMVTPCLALYDHALFPRRTTQGAATK